MDRINVNSSNNTSNDNESLEEEKHLLSTRAHQVCCRHTNEGSFQSKIHLLGNIMPSKSLTFQCKFVFLSSTTKK
jgi:hypothetical protein